MRDKIDIVAKGHYLLVFVHINLVGDDVCHDVQQRLFEQLDQHTAQHLIISLGQVNYMSSAGVAMLVKALTKIRIGGGEVILINVQEPVLRLLTLTKLDKIFTLLANLDQAEEHLQAQARN